MNGRAEIQVSSRLSSSIQELLQRQWKFVPISLLLACMLATIRLPLLPVYPLEIRITATGKQNTNAQGAVVWLRSPTFADLLKYKMRIRRTSAWEEQTGILVANRKFPCELELQGYFPQNGFLEFYGTPHAGEVQVEWDNSIQTIDLYRKNPKSTVIWLKEHLTSKSASSFQRLFLWILSISRNLILLQMFFLLLFPLYKIFPAPAAAPVAKPIRSSKRNVLLILSAGFFLLYCFAFYPGVMSPDSYTQYRQAISSQFEDWFPPTMAALWAITDKIIPGAGGMFLLHLMMAVLALLLLSFTALRKNKTLFVAPLLALLLPMISTILFVIWKDVAMAVSFLLAFSLWYFWHSKGTLSKGRLLLILAITFYGASVRHNALTAVVPLLLIFFLGYTSPRKALGLSILFAVLFFATNQFLIYYVLNAKKEYQFQATMAHDLMGIYSLTGKNHFPPSYLSPQQLDELMPSFEFESLMPAFLQGNFVTPDSTRVSELKNRWIRAIRMEPGAYLEMRFIMFRSFLTDRKGGVMHLWPVSWEIPAYLQDMPKPLMSETPLGRIHSKVVGSTYQYAGFLFKAVSYILVCIALLILSLVRKNIVAAMLSISSLLYMAPYFFVSPEINYRFIYWPVFSTLLAVFILWMTPVAEIRKQA